MNSALSRHIENQKSWLINRQSILERLKGMEVLEVK